MGYRFQFRRYRVPFRIPVRTGHGVWTDREGVLVRLVDEAGSVSFGEAAPVLSFQMESVDEIEAACRQLGPEVDPARLDLVPAGLPCLRNALGAALHPAPLAEGKFRILAALLPAGRPAVTQLKEKAESGFRVFKWKVGVGDLTEELGLLDDVCAALPSDGKLRLDANGAWDRRKAERWLERCAERPVEFVEQPAFVSAHESATQRARTDDLLLGLAQSFPTPIALDESIVGARDLERWLGLGWPGIFVVKPSLLGDIEAALAQLRKWKSDVVFSSALETAVGAQAALRSAFAWEAPTIGPTPTLPRALGFGVWPLFDDARLNGPSLAPYLRSDDVERINPGAAWNALS